MAEYDSVTVRNPLKEDFSVNWNGEPYTMPAQGELSFPKFLAFHIAKHLSDRLLAPKVLEIKKEHSTNPYRPAVGQLIAYDNPSRRITLYDILGSKELVEECINAHAFKGFVGEMKEYDEYVASKQSTHLKKEQASVEAALSKESTADASGTDEGVTQDDSSELEPTPKRGRRKETKE